MNGLTGSCRVHASQEERTWRCGSPQRLEEVRSDVRLALRQLISAPGFTLVATLTLALGIGVNSAIFSLADAALMRPLPFGQSERLVMLWERTAHIAKDRRVAAQHARLEPAEPVVRGDSCRERGMGGGPLLNAPDGSIETAERQSVSTNFFDLLEVTPIVGWPFQPEDDGPSPRVVLLGEAVWRRRLNGDPVYRRPSRAVERRALHGGRGRCRRRTFSRPAEIWTLSPQFPDIPQLRAGTQRSRSSRA